LKVFPYHAGGCNNLANMYMTTYSIDEAETYYLKSIEIDKHAIEPLYNLAVIEKTRKNHVEAEKYFKQVLTLNPKYVMCMTALADMYTKLGRFEESMELFKVCLKNQNGQEDQKSTLFSIAKLCQILDDKKTAIETYKKCLTIYPNDPTATHMLAAMTGEMVPDKPNETYIKELFDRFSVSFDKVLENLDYKAPQHIQTIIEDLYQNKKPHSMTILDAGCGTGLCGHFLKPLSSNLIGVDLSYGMLQRAKFRKEYDELIEEDLNAYFQKYTHEYDLIVSADTLCYFGDLSDFLKLSLTSLKTEGRLIFTLEKFDEETPSGYHLESHGRYSHTLSYLKESINESAFIVEEISIKELRMERGKVVEGFLVVLRKP